MKKTIKVTKNYEQFTYVRGNRTIDPLHLDRLSKAMRNEYIPVPIIVNSNYEILDGQHRFEACKRNLLPLYFMVTDDWSLNSIRSMNTMLKKWSVKDYVHSYKSLEKKLAGPYTTLEWYSKTFGLPYEASIMILHNKGVMLGKGIMDAFKSGKFTIADLTHSKKFGEFLLKIKPYWADYNKRAFINALCHLDQDHRFNRKQFLDRLDKHSMKMRKCTNALDYVQVIEYIYNCGSGTKIQFKRKDKWIQQYQPLR